METVTAAKDPDLTLRNVEIKARLDGEGGFERRIAIAKQLTGTDGELILQNDVFFNVSNGRLKLRYLTHKKSELISYDRPDVAGPKLSQYELLELDDPERLERMLASTVGVRGRVTKRRHLFLHEQTRIHLDAVDGLGHYLEFETVLRPEQSSEEGQRIVDTMMARFEITADDLVTGAYMDQLSGK
uniref:Putative adenylyl cyclase n=1 Tax=Anopheles marajoara TaxID=58244 RepID=A0A2M4C1P9_9DIPT